MKSLLVLLCMTAIQALGQEQVPSMQSAPYLLPDQDGLRAEGLLPSETAIIIEQTCPLTGADDWGHISESSGNSLEFGLNVVLPQKIPAESEFYTRYTCFKPLDRP